MRASNVTRLPSHGQIIMWEISRLIAVAIVAPGGTRYAAIYKREVLEAHVVRIEARIRALGYHPEDILHVAMQRQARKIRRIMASKGYLPPPEGLARSARQYERLGDLALDLAAAIALSPDSAYVFPQPPADALGVTMKGDAPIAWKQFMVERWDDDALVDEMGRASVGDSQLHRCISDLEEAAGSD